MVGVTKIKEGSMVQWDSYSAHKIWVLGLIHGFSRILEESLNQGPMTIWR